VWAVKEEIKAGIIIVSSFLILSALVILIGGSRFFEKVDVYSVKVMNATGLEVGTQVKLGGVRVGSVKAIKEPTGPGRPVTVEIGLKQGTPVYKGTRAMITQNGFVGDIFMLLAVDKTTAGKIMPGGEIPSEESADFAQIMTRLEGLSQTVEGLVKDVDKLFSTKNVAEIERLIGNTNKAVVSGSANIEKVASSLKSTTDKLEGVLGEVEDLVKTNKPEVTAMVKKAREDLDRAGEMIKSFESAAKSVDKATGSVDRLVDRQAAGLSDLVETVTRTAQDLQDLFQEMKQKPWSVVYKEGKDEGE
jgi:phospholipid/cholesterol/gamma-HCH transport system substrate-binding protein